MRARIAVDPKGGLVVTFAIFQDKSFNGRAFSARSSDNGASFTRPQPLTADTTSQRFENVAIDPAGRVFAAWLDKRNVAPRRAPPAAPIRARHSPTPGKTAAPASARPAWRSTIPASAAGWAWPSPAPASRPWCSATSSRARCATMPSSPSRTQRLPARCAASASTTGRSRPARITGRAWPSRPTVPSTSPGSPMARRARACSMPAPIRPTQLWRAARPVLARPPAGAALSARQRPGAASRVEGVRRHQGAGALAGQPRQRPQLERRANRRRHR